MCKYINKYIHIYVSLYIHIDILIDHYRSIYTQLGKGKSVHLLSKHKYGTPCIQDAREVNPNSWKSRRIAF